jgi:hypothetical protein
MHARRDGKVVVLPVRAADAIAASLRRRVCCSCRPRLTCFALAPAGLETVGFLAQAHQSGVRAKKPHFQGSLPIRRAQISNGDCPRAPGRFRRQEMRWGSPAELMLRACVWLRCVPVPFPPLSPLYLTRACPSFDSSKFRRVHSFTPELLLRPVTHSHLTLSLPHDATTHRTRTTTSFSNTNMRYTSAVVLSTLAVGQAAAAHNRHASFHARREA